MSEWTIYSISGVAKATVKELELHDEWMAECFLTVSVKSAAPINFVVGDYIDYRGERYSINYDPSEIKKARRDTYGDGFVYDNIKFVSVQDEIVRCDFNDIVLSDNNIHYTALPTFPFYCETVDDLLDRIQANLEELYPRKWILVSPDFTRTKQRGICVGRQQAFIDAYNQYIGAGTQIEYEKTGVALTVDNITCWDALTKVHSDFDLNFIIRERVVVVGTAGIFTANTFQYGKGNGLYEIEKVSDPEQKVVTRLRAYGSEQNLPERYYAEKNPRAFFSVADDYEHSSTATSISVLIDNNKFYNVFVNVVEEVSSSHKICVASCEMDDIEFDAAFELVSGNDATCTTRMLVGADGTVIISGETLPTVPQSVIDALKANMVIGSQIIFKSGINKKYVDSSHIIYSTTGLPSNMAVNRLMLPGFPEISLDEWVRANRPELIEQGFTFSTDPARPYIDSPNKDIYGVRPSNIFFDGSNDTEDIHPSIEGMTWNNVACDAVVIADQIEDNGVLPEDATDKEKRVNITIPYAGFELDELWSEEATISMKNGMCGAREFKIAKKPTNDTSGNWVCSCERDYDDTLHLYFPYNDFQINVGDKFVLLGIELPDSYIDAASAKLFDAAVEVLKANHAPRETYQPKIDHIWMQHQHDSSGGSLRSLHDTLKAGDIFRFKDDDLAIDAAVTIDILTIKENGDNGIPTYEITLRDEKTVSPIQKIQDKVDSIFSGSINGSGSGGGFSVRQLASILENYGREYFLSKRYDDETPYGLNIGGDLGVKGKITTDTIISSDYTGSGMLDTGFKLWYEDGRAKMVIDDLTARGKFSVYELESRIMTHTGGDVVFSGAGSKLFYVEYLDGNDNPMGYTTINAPWMLGSKLLLSGVTGLAAWSNRRKIQRELSDSQKASIEKFRCYVFSDDGTTKTRNWWRVNDLARCQTFDHTQMKQNSEGYYSGTNVSNTVYWRRVAGIGSKAIEALGDGVIYDYFDLWNVPNVQGRTYIDIDGSTKTITDSTPGYDSTYNDWPAAGDDVVQFGNAVDTDRQAMVTIEVTSGEPGMKVYNGVHDYSTQGCKWVGIGYDSTIKRAYADVFGDFYFGDRGSVNPRDGRSYLRFNSQTGLLEFKGRMSLSSTYGNGTTTLEDYINSITWSQEQIEEMIGDGIEVVQKQIDGSFDVYYEDVAPTTSNYPASQWTTTELKERHLYDLYYDKTHKAGYRWAKTINGEVATYGWEQIGDTGILASLAAAADAQDTADGKRRVFTNDPNDADPNKRHPNPPYDEGDLWAQGSTGDILRCEVRKYEDEQYAASDWTKASKYTDDSNLMNFVDVTYAADKENLQNQIDGKYETFFYDGVPTLNNLPASQWTTTDLKDAHVGDLYWDKTNEHAYRFIKTVNGSTTTYSWSQIGDSSVIAAMAEAAAAQDTADGKRRVFTSTPTTPYDVGDLWSQGPTGDLMKCKNARATGNYDASDWEKASKYTDDTNLEIFRQAQALTNQTLQGGINALDYIKGALGATTDIQGGLMLTTLIALRKKNNDNSYTTWAGMNGNYIDGSTIAAWYGGGMVDYEKLTDAQKAQGWDVQRWAMSLFRMDGSGYVAGGNITWTNDGVVTVRGNTVAMQQIIINGVDYTNFFSMFTLENTGTTASPQYRIKANYDFYSVGDVSAQGASSGGGGGGGGGGATTLDELNDVTISGNLLNGQALVYDSVSHHWINQTIAQALANLTDVDLSTLADGQVLSYDATSRKWKPVDAAEAQVQANWNETDQTSAAFIQNKPTIPTLSNTNTGYAANADNALATTNQGDLTAISGTTKFDAGLRLYRVYNNGYPTDYGNLLRIGGSGLGEMVFGWTADTSTGRIYYRSKRDVETTSWSGWKTLAWTSDIPSIPSNVSSFTNDVGYITGSGSCNYANSAGYADTVDGYHASSLWRSDGATWNPQANVGMYASNDGDEWSFDMHRNGHTGCIWHVWDENNGSILVVDGATARVGVGVTNPSYKLQVSGDIYATGDVTGASDGRKKDVIEEAKLTLEQIAEAPAVKFRWKDKRDEDVHAGTIAQYWQKVLPEVVSDKGDELGVNYGAAAMVASINLAKEVVELRKMVLELKAEIEQLKKGGAS